MKEYMIYWVEYYKKEDFELKRHLVFNNKYDFLEKLDELNKSENTYSIETFMREKPQWIQFYL